MRVKGASGDQILREKALADRDGLLCGTTRDGQEQRQMGSGENRGRYNYNDRLRPVACGPPP